VCGAVNVASVAKSARLRRSGQHTGVGGAALAARSLGGASLLGRVALPSRHSVFIARLACRAPPRPRPRSPRSAARLPGHGQGRAGSARFEGAASPDSGFGRGRARTRVAHLRPRPQLIFSTIRRVSNTLRGGASECWVGHLAVALERR
jgi:hypothetical protein